MDHAILDGSDKGKIALRVAVRRFSGTLLALGDYKLGNIKGLPQREGTWRCGCLFGVVLGPFDIVMWSIRGSFVL